MNVNTTPAVPYKYQAVIEKFPNLKYTLQSVSFPSITMAPIEVYPHEADYTLTPDRLLYSPLSFNFIVDDTYENLNTLLNWMQDLISTDDAHLTEYTQIIILLYNRQNIPVKQVIFKDVFCSGLGGFELSTTEESSILVCDATFDFSTFKMENI